MVRPSTAFVSKRIPLYYQLENLLREKILSGAFAPGDRIPTESDLIRRYGVSRITVRQALTALAGEGLIERRQGRGTFVTDRVVDNHVVTLRKKIEPEPGRPRYLVSVRGMGYRFEG